LPHQPSFARRLAADLGFDHIQFADPAQCFDRQRRRPGLVDVMELASRMRPAGGFPNRAVVEQRDETGIGISLQNAFEIGEVRSWVDPLAIRRIGEPHGRRRSVGADAVVAHVSPQARGFGFAVAWRQHRDRRVVRVQLGRASTWRRIASTSGRCSALATPTRLASSARSRSTPSRA
jgi:hypothetical protein